MTMSSPSHVLTVTVHQIDRIPTTQGMGINRDYSAFQPPPRRSSMNDQSPCFSLPYNGAFPQTPFPEHPVHFAHGSHQGIDFSGVKTPYTEITRRNSLGPQTDMHNTSPQGLDRPPTTWKKDDVTRWLLWCAEEFAFEKEKLNLPKFQMNGKALCMLTKSDFIDRAPGMGDVLFNTLESLRSEWNPMPGGFRAKDGNKEAPHSPKDYKPLVLTPNSPISPTKKKCLSREETPAEAPTPAAHDSTETPIDYSIKRTPDPSTMPPSLHPTLMAPTAVAQTPNHCNGSSYVQYPPISTTRSPSTSLTSLSLQSTPSLAEMNPDLRIDKPTSDCPLLWEFLYELLSNRTPYSCVVWENESQYEFRILDRFKLAQLWGEKKKKETMTYDKLCRALRYYYKMKIITKIPGKRYTYRFLIPPTMIKKGIRGAKPGVPHKRRTPKPPKENNSTVVAVATESSDQSASEKLSQFVDKDDFKWENETDSCSDIESLSENSEECVLNSQKSSDMEVNGT